MFPRSPVLAAELKPQHRAPRLAPLQRPQLLQKPHADVDYLKQQDISLVLSKALAETFKAKPIEPRKYFAKYLLNFAAQKRKEQKVSAPGGYALCPHPSVLIRSRAVGQRREQLEQVGIKKQTHERRELMKEREAAEQVRKQDAKVAEDNAFFETLEKSRDLNDNLPALVDFIKKNTGATGVYIGKLQFPDKKITIDADDKAHFDPEAPKVVKFIHANPDHEFMVDAVLTPDKGVTHDVFGPTFTRLATVPPTEGEALPTNGEEEVKEAAPVPEPDDDILARFKHIYVKEVVREPRMNF